MQLPQLGDAEMVEGRLPPDTRLDTDIFRMSDGMNKTELIFEESAV